MRARFLSRNFSRAAAFFQFTVEILRICRKFERTPKFGSMPVRHQCNYQLSLITGHICHWSRKSYNDMTFFLFFMKSYFSWEVCDRFARICEILRVINVILFNCLVARINYFYGINLFKVIGWWRSRLYDFVQKHWQFRKGDYHKYVTLTLISHFKIKTCAITSNVIHKIIKKCL